MREVNINKAIGPDGIPSKFLRECSHELSYSVCALYNYSLATGMLPQLWKRANVVPLYKKGNPNLVNNYRPVSLLPVIVKILEKLIHSKIINNLKGKITASQHGFLPSCSTVTQLLSTFMPVNEDLDNNLRNDIIYFDLAKAFDSVPHHLLIHKLQSFGFNGSLLRWMSNYLHKREQRVVVNGCCSSWLPVKSGVPQGATLGPLKFLLFVNDLPNSLTEGTRCAIFADDTKILRTISTPADVATLQCDINNLVTWSEIWGLRFNEDKCMVLSARKASTLDQLPPPQYKMNNKTLNCTTSMMDLGVTIDPKLSWSQHINFSSQQNVIPDYGYA